MEIGSDLWSLALTPTQRRTVLEVRFSCSKLCSVGFEASPEKKIPQLLWDTALVFNQTDWIFFLMLNHFPLFLVLTLPSSFHGGPSRRARFRSGMRFLPFFPDVPQTLGAPTPFPTILEAPWTWLLCINILQMKYHSAEHRRRTTFILCTQSFKLTSACYD